jgi:tetratricopeptide (TPR) repeat protein
MARVLNKNLVGILTLFGMVLLALTGFVLLLNLPGQDPKTYEAKAQGLEEAGEYNRARQTYLRAYRKDPARDPEYLVMAARCAIEEGDSARASALLEQALVKDSELKSALRLATELNLELGRMLPSGRGKLQWSRILERANRLLEVDDQSPLAHYAAGLAYVNLREEDEAFEAKGEECLKRALELDPTNVDVVTSAAALLWTSARRLEVEGRMAGATARKDSSTSTLASAIEKCEALGEENKVSELRQLQAYYLILAGSTEEGIAALEVLAQSETTQANCHLLLANLYAGYISGQVETDLARAQAMATAALEIDPGDGRIYRLLGQLYKRQDRDDEATDLYRRGLDDIPYDKHFRSLKNNQARLFFMTELFMGDIKRALELKDNENGAKYDEALAAAESWITRMKEEIHEDSLAVRFLIARHLSARGEYIASTREAEAANRLPRAEKHFRLQELLGELYVRHNQWGAAREALVSALNLKPTASDLRTSLGEVYLRLGHPAMALRLLKPSEAGQMRDALDKDEMAVKLRAEAYKQLGQFELASEEIAHLGQGSAAIELQRADILLSEGREEEAEQRIKAAVEQEPENREALEALVRFYQITDQVEKARLLIDDLLAKEPENRMYRRLEWPLLEPGDETDKVIEGFLMEEEDEFARAMSLCTFYNSRGKREEADKHLDEAERLQPDNPKVLERQLRSALIAGDWGRTEKYVRRHRELNLDGAEGKIAEARVALAREQFDRAIELFRAGLEVYPNYSMGWAYMADAYLALDRLSEAKSILKHKALRIDPTNGYAARKMAEIARNEGDEKSELRYLRLASRYLADDSAVRQRYQILREREDPRKGIVSREKIRGEDPGDADNLILLARLYALREVSDYDKAAEVYREALEVSGYRLDWAREVAAFLGRKEVNEPAEGEALLKKMLDEEDDQARKALIAVSLGQLDESRELLAAADQYFGLAVSLDPSLQVLVLAAEFYARTNQDQDALDYYDRALALAKKATGERSAVSAKTIRAQIISMLLTGSNLENAKHRIDEYTKKYPNDPQGMMFEGAYHRMGGDVEESKKAFDMFLEKHSDSSLALWQRGRLHALMGRWQLAISDLKKAKIFGPDGYGYQHRIALADALLEVGQGDEAIDELLSILEENPENQIVASALVDVYRRVNPPRLSEAENLIYTYMRQFPDDLRWPMILGELGERSGDWSTAIQGYETAVELAQYARGTVPALFRVYKAAGRPRNIIDFAKRKLSGHLPDGMPLALSSLAWAYDQTGEKEECLEAFDRALAAAGDNFAARAQVAKEMEGVLGKEVALAHVMSQTEPAAENVDKLRAVVHLLWLGGQEEDAIKICDQLSEVAVQEADQVFGMLAKAMLLERLDRHSEAKAAYEEVLRLDPKQPMALNNLAYLLVEQLDNPAEALPYVTQANQLYPGDPGVLDTLGWALARSGRLGEATGRLLRAIEIERDRVDRDHIAAAYHLGMVHLLRGEQEEAEQRLNSAKKAAKDQDDTHYGPLIDRALREARGS